MALPSKATASTAGEIVLGGDLTGTGASPTLITTGIEAGTYVGVTYASIDNKGRYTSIGALSSPGGSFSSDFAPIIGDASASNKGIFSIRSDSGINISSGQVSTFVATSSVKGTASIGTGLSVASSTLNLDPTTIQSAAVGQRGLFQLGTNFSKSGTAIQYVQNPTPSVLGTYKIGTGLSKFGNFLTRTLAEAAVLGIGYSADTTSITVTGGALNVGANVVRLDTFNTFTKAQAPGKTTQTCTSSVSPNFTNSTSIEVVLDQNITLTAPTGTVVGGVYTLLLTQDGTGSRTVSLSGYATASAFTASTDPAATDLITIIHIDTSVFLFILNDRF